MPFVVSSKSAINETATSIEIYYSLTCNYNLLELFRYNRGGKCIDI